MKLASSVPTPTVEPQNKLHKVYQENTKTTTILSVDDDPTNQVVIHKLLSPYFGIIQAMVFGFINPFLFISYLLLKTEWKRGFGHP